MTKKQFFKHLLFQICLGCFFIFLAIQLLPLYGWGFSTFFCCVFATNSLSTSIRMYTTYQKFKDHYQNLTQETTDTNQESDKQHDSTK
ncbi:protein of unknown function [Granulicatella balaenopterae]|uniref:Uncharacterized protein n=1 Tax=Granulicatella balaenopterae TaxID=137733 RepID=A0A1H9JJP8_9LACT|nr:YdiK family protein [Granulicatella balaenopterae]SEQ87019.1 protein of unknown function [Granulicatella balaenopterae]